MRRHLENEIGFDLVQALIPVQFDLDALCLLLEPLPDARSKVARDDEGRAYADAARQQPREIGGWGPGKEGKWGMRRRYSAVAPPANDATRTPTYRKTRRVEKMYVVRRM